MQDGLHIGLGAWINAQRSGDGFAVFPALPVQTSLADLGTIQGAHDLSKAAEFARLVNFVPRNGQFADAFGSVSLLWDVHRDILSRMDFAIRPLTNAERAQFQAAQNLLYTPDAAGRLLPSETLLLYEEMKNAYRDVEETGGSAEELAQALTDWIVQGHKQSVEDALEAIVRLARRSSRVHAENERAALEDVRLARHAELTFAPTYFAPISAIARETWLEATVSFGELDRAVGGGPESSKWKAFLANRSGDVTFEYIILTCIRPWYTPSLYSADDWRLSPEETVVSTGNGSDGLLPAYVAAVYLASVKNVTTPPKPPVTPTPVVSVRHRSMLMREVVAERPVRPALLEANGRLASPALRPPMVLRTEASAGDRPVRTLTAPRRLAATHLTQRVAMARALLLERDRPVRPPPPEPTASLIYVTGFGCEKIPLAPNPNPHYQW